jgi:hypothetical protein
LTSFEGGVACLFHASAALPPTGHVGREEEDMGSPWIFEGTDVVRLADETDRVRIGAGGTPTRALEVVGTALATLQDRGGNVFDVRAYGAKGDGSTDDRGAIQAAIDALPASGGTLYLPPGTTK